MKPISFRDQFNLSNGGPFEFDGFLVHRAFKIAVTEPRRLRLSVLKASHGPQQALHLYASNCRMRIGRDERHSGLLWIADCLDKIVEIELTAINPPGTFGMWNATSDRIGGSTNDSWGNYGVIIQAIGANSWLLNFSQSMLPDPPNFEALVIKVEVEM